MKTSTSRRLVALTASLAAICALPWLAGCWSSGGERHSLVFGLGVVSVRETPDQGGQAGGTYRRMQADGVMVTGQPDMAGLLVGHAEQETLVVPEGASVSLDAVRMEVRTGAKAEGGR